MSVLVDTSAWIEALRQDGDPAIRETVATVTRDGRAAFCDMVLLEPWNGARGRAEREVLCDLERNIDTVETSAEVWSTARTLAQACRSGGLTVPATDLLIAAVATVHGLELLHNDKHFRLIAQLET